MRNLKVISSAAIATLGMSGLAHAQYTSVSTFDGAYPVVDASEAWDFRADPINAPTVYDHWSGDVLPTSGSLVLFPVNSSSGQQTLTLGTPRTVYAVNLTTPSGSGGNRGVTLSGGTLVLLSQDSVTNSLTNQARAIDVSFSGVTTGGDRLRITSGIVLGDGNQGAGVHYAYVNNNIADAALAIENRVSEFAGSSWGMVFTGDKRIELKSSNYLNHEYLLSGGVEVAAGAHIRVYNNLFSRAGDLTLNGQFRISQNSGDIVLNGLQGTNTAAILTTNTSNRNLVIGANNANSSYAGTVTAGINLYKVGTGDLPLTNSANNFTGNLIVSNGSVSFGSIANSGTASQLGNGNTSAAGINIDGGKLVYTGNTDSTSNRTFTVGLRGGGIESNGTGALVLGSASWGAVSTDTAISAGRHNSTAPTPPGTVTGMTAINGLSSLISNLTLSGGATGAITSLDESTGTMVMTTGTLGAPGSGAAAAQFVFTANSAVDRALTLGGSSTANNTVAASMANSPLSRLGIVKTGAGKWIIDNPQYMSGDVTVNQGTLVVDGDTAAAATITGNTVTSGTTVTGVSSTAGLVVGQPVTGAGIAPGTSIRSIDTVNNTITLSVTPTAPGTGVSLSLPAGTGSGLGNVTVNNTGTYVNNKSQFVGGNAQAAGAASTFTVNAGGTATVTDTLKVWNTGTVDVSGNLNVGNIISTGAVSIHNNGTVKVVQSAPAPQGDDARTSIVNSVSIANDGAPLDPSTFRNYSGTLDLVNNDMIVRGGSVADIQDMIRSGRVELGGSGRGIASSESQTGTYAGVTALGVIQNDDGFGNPIYTTWNGVSGLTIADILIKYTWYGDADLSGVVDDFDFALLDAGYTGAGTGWFYGDFDLNGAIDDFDFALLDAGFTGGGAGTHLPEPGLAVVGAAGLAGLLRRRRC